MFHLVIFFFISFRLRIWSYSYTMQTFQRNNIFKINILLLIFQIAHCRRFNVNISHRDQNTQINCMFLLAKRVLPRFWSPDSIFLSCHFFSTLLISLMYLYISLKQTCKKMCNKKFIVLSCHFYFVLLISQLYLEQT